MDKDGKPYTGSWLIAIDPSTQKEKWRVQGGGSIGGGALTTAGNLVFQTTNNGRLLAYTADTGEKLLDVATNQTGGMGPPITFMVDNKQYVAVAGGSGPRGQRGPGGPGGPGGRTGRTRRTGAPGAPGGPGAVPPAPAAPAGAATGTRCTRRTRGARRAASPLRVHARRKSRESNSRSSPCSCRRRIRWVRPARWRTWSTGSARWSSCSYSCRWRWTRSVTARRIGALQPRSCTFAELFVVQCSIVICHRRLRFARFLRKDAAPKAHPMTNDN